MTRRATGDGRRGRTARGPSAPASGSLSLFEEPATLTPPPPAREDLDPDPGSRPTAAISVATLAAATRDILEGSLPPLWVRGEIVGFKRHRGGHWYFTLKDDAAQIRCVVWASDARRLHSAPNEGMAVVVRGALTVYAAKSDLQLRVLALEPAGDGQWRKAFDATRARLEADGLLDPERKRALPRYPRRIAIVTSPDGAALHDIVAVVRRRCPTVQLVAVPAVVQGDGAPASLCRALRRIAKWQGVDLVIIGRGGGGREELWAFNDERVARALAACPVPTIAAIGHEIDVTLCDLVADWRAATPSAAGEAAVPVLDDLRSRLRNLRGELVMAADAQLASGRARLARAARDMAHAADRVTERRRQLIDLLAGKLDVLSPVATMARGFAIVTDATGGAVSSARRLSTGDAIGIRFQDGRATARVDAVEPEPRGRRDV
jgi:exodeoxyribonuclease VII large subunit